jgi:hypothetical protein
MKFRLLVTTTALLLATSVAAQDAPLPPFDNSRLPSLPAPHSSRFRPIQSTFGTLAFDGIAERVDLGAAYEFRVLLAITFRSSEEWNRVGYPSLRVAELRAIIPTAPRVQVVKTLSQDIAVDVFNDGETKWLPPLTFRLDKATYDAVGHVGLDLLDVHHVMWPVGGELKFP